MHHSIRTSLRSLSIALTAAGALALGAGCSHNETKPTPQAAAPAPAPVAKAATAADKGPAVAADLKANRPSTDALLFGFDAHLLEPESQARLQEIAKWLAENPGTTVRISGHADDRGTSEYNLALGDARARVARDYLVRLGVSPDRIRFESLGEERPAVAGNDEDAYAKNRRDEIVFDG